MNTVFMHCRPGFEGEVCSEIAEHAARLNVAGYAKAKPSTACAEFVCTEEDGAERLMRGLRFAELIFPRQWARGSFIALPETDRISVILEHMADFPVCGSLWLEMVDTNDGKELSNFCKKFDAHLRKALISAGKLVEDDAHKPRLLLTFKSGREVFLGLAESNNSAMWPMGIPRLKFPREAPSRSTLKLEEAWHHFIPRDQWDERLHSDMTGVDLGAAPGGWTRRCRSFARHISCITLIEGVAGLLWNLDLPVTRSTERLHLVHQKVRDDFLHAEAAIEHHHHQALPVLHVVDHRAGRPPRRCRRRSPEAAAVRYGWGSTPAGG